MNIFKKKWYQWFQRKLTVACDVSPFWSPVNESEQLFHKNGILKARLFAKDWVRKHPYGQARIIYGHKEWKENENQNGLCNEQ